MTEKIANVVVGTAGHIDHGKSALIKRLTGIDPDRLKEEKERGLTIDLGFANLVLPDGRRVGFIDVPGHERFIKNMVAGATNIDIVLFVVAADDGIMPQTREHLEILRLLELKMGIIVVTKIDLVDKDFLELVEDDIKTLVQGTFLEGAPIVPVSSLTGEGIEKLHEELFLMITRIAPRSAEGPFRLPVQRAFSIRGHGTVVTGVPISGSARIGDTLEIQPGGFKGRIRSIQAYGKPVESARAGHSAAFNLSDIEPRQVARGCVLATPGYFAPAPYLIGKVTLCADEHSVLKDLSPVHLHIGTAAVMVTPMLVGQKIIAPGQSAYVILKPDSPVIASPRDRFILRMHSPHVTVGGGIIIGLAHTKPRRFRKETLEELQVLEEAIRTDESWVEHIALTAGMKAVERQHLQLGARLDANKTRKVLDNLIHSGKLVEMHHGGKVVHARSLSRAGELLKETMADYHKRNPYSVGIEKEALKRACRLDPELFDYILNNFAASGQIKMDHDKYHLPEFKVSLSETQSELGRRLEELYLEGKFSTPRLDELPALIGKRVDEIGDVLYNLIEKGILVKLSDDILIHKEWLQQAEKVLLELGKQNREIIPANFKEALGTSRKYAIPILEHFDKRGLTIRVGGKKYLRKSIE